jgi:hypothetical protein
VALGEAAEERTRDLLSSPDVDVRLRARRVLEGIAASRFEPDARRTALALLAFMAAGYSHKAQDEFRAGCTYGDVVSLGLSWLRSRRDDAPLTEATALASHALVEVYNLTGDREWEAVARTTADGVARQQKETGAWSDDTWTTYWAVLTLDGARIAGLRDDLAPIRRGLEWVTSHAAEGSALAIMARCGLAWCDSAKPPPLTVVPDPSTVAPRERLLMTWASCMAGDCRAWRKALTKAVIAERARWKEEDGVERCAFDAWARALYYRDCHYRNVFSADK